MWVSTHAQVVVAAPHRHVPLVLQGGGVVVGHGERLGQPVDRLEHTVGVVALLLLDLLLKELIVLEVGDCGAQEGRRTSVNHEDKALHKFMLYIYTFCEMEI